MHTNHPRVLGAFLGVLACGAVLAYQGEAGACSPARPPDPFAIPLPGAAGVSTATSILIAASDYPPWVEITAGGLPVKFDGLEPSDYMVSPPDTRFWRPRAVEILQPDVEYVVTMAGLDSSQRTELTRFTTGAGYDKDSGTAPVLKSLGLWRVKYRVDEIGSGNCVFAEYHGAIALDYTEASVPGTPPAATRYTLYLSSKNGGYYGTTTFLGDNLFKGAAPEGGHPFPSFWPPALDPTQEYCAMLRVQGYGDLARLPLDSNQLCAKVTEIDTTGGTTGGGTSDAGTADASATKDTQPEAANGGGCSTAGDPGGASVAGMGFMLLAAIWLLRRRG